MTALLQTRKHLKRDLKFAYGVLKDIDEAVFKLQQAPTDETAVATLANHLLALRAFARKQNRPAKTNPNEWCNDRVGPPTILGRGGNGYAAVQARRAGEEIRAGSQ